MLGSNKKMLSFKKRFSVEARLKESTRIRKHYPDKTPIICESTTVAEGSWKPSALISNAENVKTKYIVPGTLTSAEFINVLRKKMNITSDVAICLYVCIPNGGTTITSGLREMRDLYDEYADPDGMLYFIYGAENTFGTI
jgi:GABA(A) receptor-associated protein